MCAGDGEIGPAGLKLNACAPLAESWSAQSAVRMPAARLNTLNSLKSCSPMSLHMSIGLMHGREAETAHLCCSRTCPARIAAICPPPAPCCPLMCFDLWEPILACVLPSRLLAPVVGTRPQGDSGHSHSVLCKHVCSACLGSGLAACSVTRDTCKALHETL